jgi:hypothetical protein
MAISVYYDGSADGNRKHWLTLAGFSATDRRWKEFNSHWHKVLGDHNAPRCPVSQNRYIHMNEAMFGTGGYTGWKIDQVKRLVKDLCNILFQYNGKIHGAVCTVNLDDYCRAKRIISGHPDSPECICVDTCVSAIAIPPYYRNRRRVLRLYFDKNEPFLHKINRVWERNKRRNGGGWPLQIAIIASVDMHIEYGVQAADLIAWIFNRHYNTGDHEDMYSWARFQPSKLFDYEKILARYNKPALS